MASIENIDFDLNEVSKQFCFMAGISCEEGEKFLSLIQGEAENIFAQLKSNVNTEQAESRLIRLTAALAYKKYCLIEGGDSFRIGEISARENVDSATALADEYMAECWDLLEDKGFFFGSM
jgi:hypothetical protein